MTQVEVLSQLKEKDGITFSKQYLGKLVKEGKIPYTEVKGKKKSFEYEAVKQALQNMKQRLPNGEKFNAQNEDGSTKTINSTKIFLQEYQGELAKIKVDVAKGELVPRDEVEQKAFTVMRVVRDQILAVPERLAGDLASTTDVKEVKEIMFKELNQVLLYLSDEKVLYE